MLEQHVLMLAVADVFPDASQPRESFAEEDEIRMAASIAVHGILQPIRVRHTDHGWIVLSGEYRLRGAKRAGLETVPCIEVKGDLSAAMIFEEQIVENVARNSLRPMELARSLAKLKTLKGCTSQTLADAIGMTGASVCRMASLLRLPLEIQAMVDDGRVPESSAYELTKLNDDAAAQFELAAAIAAGKCTRDQAADAVRERSGTKRKVKPKGARLPLRVDGVNVTISAGEPLSWDAFNAAMDRIRKEAKKLYEGGKDVTELARQFRAS